MTVISTHDVIPLMLVIPCRKKKTNKQTNKRTTATTTNAEFQISKVGNILVADILVIARDGWKRRLSLSCAGVADFSKAGLSFPALKESVNGLTPLWRYVDVVLAEERRKHLASATNSNQRQPSFFFFCICTLVDILL